jgi:signal transduction histidine kinase
MADALYVVLDGELDVTKRSGTADIPVARVGPGALQGEIAALEGGRRLASVHAATRAEVLRIPIGGVRELLGAGPDVALSVIRTAVGRLRSMEATLREREKLASLGTLAAGLAHELNNPAAAAARSTRALAESIERVQSLRRPDALPAPPADAGPPTSALERGDRIDEVADVTGSAETAPALVDAGWDARALRQLSPDVLPWVAADASVRSLLAEVTGAVDRISEIVSAVKGYVYLDQGPRQRIDVRAGLEQTLVMLRHQIREGGASVVTKLDEPLPEIEAYGSALNQVWTNLVDNAVDAMGGRGRLRVRAVREGEGVLVEIADSGPGVPQAIRGRIFDPFFTTKGVGEGTGLGLDLVRRIVAQHHGELRLESSPGDTRFQVRLPVRLPRPDLAGGEA